MAQQNDGADILHHLQHDMIEALFDTFAAYLRLPSVIPHVANIGNTHIETISDLLDWVLDDDDENRSKTFVKALDIANKKGTVVLQDQTQGQNINKYLGMLVKTLDGHLLHRLQPNDVISISDSMLKEKFISQRQKDEVCKKVINSNCEAICIEMFGMIKRGKPQWPFKFFEAMKTVRPDLLHDCTEGATGLSLEHEQSSPPSGFSDLVDTFSGLSVEDREEIQSSSRIILQLPEEAVNSPVMREIIRRGVIQEDRVHVSDTVQPTHFEYSCDAGFSDEEEKHEFEESEKAAQSSGPPSLHLRQYQLELAQTALKGENTIICAPTGSGKTRVSTYIILKHLQPDEERKKKVAFLARTVPLVQQQCNSLKKYLPSHYQIGQVTGESEFREDVKFLLPSHEVIVMTPKVLENHIMKKALRLGDFTLMIFDECHHTRKDEPYNNLMFMYLKTKKEQPTEILPQIVGLTATIGIEKASGCEKAVENILKVCGNLDCDNISMVYENKEELEKIVPVPDEKILSLREMDRNASVMAIERTMTKLEDHVRQHAKELQKQDITKQVEGLPPMKKSQHYNQWAVELKRKAKSTPILDQDKETNLSVRCLIILADYLKDFNVALEALDLVQLTDVMQYLDKCFERYKENERRTRGETLYYQYFQDLKEELRQRQHRPNGNLTILADVLREYLTNRGDKSCGIIFVRTRALAYALTSWMKRCGIEHLQNLNACMFTGAGAKADQLGMTQADQETVIQDFREGTTRLLVATTVAEEGLDIPECNLVIKYNHVGNEVTTVQTRGRSRKKGGISILLAMENVANKERVNQGKAKLMNEALEKIHGMPKEDIKGKNTQHQDMLIEEAERKMILNQRSKKQVSDVNFAMVCGLCRKLTIQSEDVKTIASAHRVAIDSSLWNKKKVKILPYKQSQQIDDVRMLGSVRCMMEPEPGKHCFNHLGSMILYSDTPFINLGIKNFAFHVGNTKNMHTFKKWKDVPFKVEELSATHIQRYFDSMKSETDADVEAEEDSGFSAQYQSEAINPDNTEVKLLHSEEKDNDETHPKEILHEEATDSVFFSGISQNSSSRSNENTLLKEPFPVPQQPHNQVQELPSGSVIQKRSGPSADNTVPKKTSRHGYPRRHQSEDSLQQAMISSTPSLNIQSLQESINRPNALPSSLNPQSQAQGQQLEINQQPARDIAISNYSYLSSNGEMPSLQISVSSLSTSGANPGQSLHIAGVNNPSNSPQNEEVNHSRIDNRNDLNFIENEDLVRNNFADERNIQEEELSAGSRESNASVFKLL